MSTNTPEYEFQEQFLPEANADHLRRALISEADWRPRADGELVADTHPVVAPVRDRICDVLGFEPDGCVLHYDKSGQSPRAFYIRPESLETVPTSAAIAVVSLDVERDMFFTRDGGLEGESVPLTNGSLFCLMPRTARRWGHELGVSDPPGDGRVSLTFYRRSPPEEPPRDPREPIEIAEDFEYQFSKPGAPLDDAPFRVAVRSADHWLQVGTAILLPTACRIASEIAQACPEFEAAIIDHRGRRVM